MKTRGGKASAGAGELEGGYSLSTQREPRSLDPYWHTVSSARMSEESDLEFKIVFIGDSGVGKVR